ncbi:hypothetical protein CTI12_AA570240 [Artemisia annua]|uniref:Uncharacterized protein n=1 Tax=Artemisia annua TaxID=35608 RepID=A0A2U1KRQ0_ARTAN|nr:hypothetical protein CTI12_AA570240 [Artemisia annua]
MSKSAYTNMDSHNTNYEIATSFNQLDDEIPLHTGIQERNNIANHPKRRGRPPTIQNKIVNSNDILKRAPGRRPSSFDISDISIRRPGKQPIKNNDLLPRKPGRPPKQKTTTATSETTTNIECDLSFRQSCKRKSERLKDKTRNVRKKKFSHHRDNHTSINDGDVTRRQSFVGISNDYIDHGDAIVECESCNALLWNQESMIGNTHTTTEKYSLCCGRGKVKLGDQVEQPPKLLMELSNGEHPKSTTNHREQETMPLTTS